MITRLFFCFFCILLGLNTSNPARTFAQTQKFSAPDPAQVPGRTQAQVFLIKIKPEFRPASVIQRRASAPVSAWQRALAQINVGTVSPKFPGTPPGTNGKLNGVDLSLWYEVQYPDTAVSFTQVKQVLLGTGQVEYVEPVYLPEILYQPNDPLADSVKGNQFYLKQIQAYKAWDVEKGDSSVVIGILDTGTRLDHEDLVKKIKRNYADPVDGIDNDRDGFRDNFMGWDTADKDNNPSANGHGTLVTGLAAAAPDNGIGIAGIGFNCRYLPIKVFSSKTNGAFGGYEGIKYAADYGCQVINLSWGSNENPYSQFEQDVINYAVINKNVVVVAAGGNTPTEKLFYPASYDNVLAVCAVDRNDVKGNSQTYNYQIDLTAPGIEVTTTSSDATNTYAAVGGSSMASPIVAGAAGLLRKKFPDYTAIQIAERLRVTADNNYGAGNNRTYLDKLGFGRLNVYRALAEAAPKAVRNTTNEYDYRQVFAGNVLPIRGTFRNILAPVADLFVTLSSSSPYVTVIRSTYVAGAMATLTTKDNAEQPFEVLISPDMPLNHAVTFRYGYSDGAYTDYQYFTLILNPDYLTLRIGDLDATVISRGNIGYNGLNAAQGESVIYKNFGPMLSEGGLLVGVSSANVSDNIRNQSFRSDGNFTTLNPIRFAGTGKRADEEAYGAFKDNYPQTGTVGVSIKQRAFSWQNAPNDNFVILEYQVTNTTSTELTNLHAGLFADWDISSYVSNTADWDSVTRMGYTYHASQKNVFAGISLITPQPATTYAINSKITSPQDINLADGFTNAEKFKALQNASKQNQTTGLTAGDVAQVVGGRIDKLAPGQSTTIAFALVGANSLPVLQESAQAALQQYQRLKAGPVILAATDSVCLGDQATIRPAGGKLFRFYADAAKKQLLATGSSYTTSPLQVSTTYYISNIDSLYESSLAAITIHSAISRPVDFAVMPRQTTSTDFDNAAFTDLNQGSQKWYWDFGNGKQSTERNPTTQYNQPGTYQVKLRVMNNRGCVDSLVKSITFSPGSLPVVQNDTTCRGNSYVIQPGGGTRFNFYADAAGQNRLGSGPAYVTPALLANTTYYVSTSSGFFESPVVPVRIVVTQIKAAFTFSPDPVSAGAKGQITFTNQTSKAVAWDWDLGNNTRSQARNPVVTYGAPGTYAVTLRVRDAYGCVDSLTRPVEIKYLDYLRHWQEADIQVFPVPTPQILQVVISEGIDATQGLTLTLINTVGKLVYKKVTYGTGRQPLDLNNLPNGIYYLRISGQDGLITRRVEVLR